VLPGKIQALIVTHRERITDLIPQSEPYLSGSTLLGRFGGHDIDLVVLVPSVWVAAELLRSKYPPLYENEWRDDWAAFRSPGPPQVDIVLTREGTRGDAHHRRAWDLLLADDALRAEYAARKEAGMTGEQKRVFFEQVVARLDVEAAAPPKPSR
jgi:hypothetical protein